MSAFICESQLFHLLVAYRAREMREHDQGEDSETAWQKFGQMLVDANYASVNHRYRENETPPTYVVNMAAIDGPLDIMQVVKAAHCLNYQSCEVSDWDQQPAREALRAIVWDAVCHLPGYEAARWGA